VSAILFSSPLSDQLDVPYGVLVVIRENLGNETGGIQKFFYKEKELFRIANATKSENGFIF